MSAPAVGNASKTIHLAIGAVDALVKYTQLLEPIVAQGPTLEARASEGLSIAAGAAMTAHGAFQRASMECNSGSTKSVEPSAQASELNSLGGVTVETRLRRECDDLREQVRKLQEEVHSL